MSEQIPEDINEKLMDIDRKSLTPWELLDGKIIGLISPEMLTLLPEGTELTSIGGKSVVVGTDYIDDETRGGPLPYGLPMDEVDVPKDFTGLILKNKNYE